MKSMLVACLIAIALLTSCSKDNPVDPNTDPKTTTTVNAYIVKFNAMTNDWDMSTKMLWNIMKFDHKGSMYKRFYNDNFTKNSKSFYSVLLGRISPFSDLFASVGCIVSDSITGVGLYTYSYTNDATGYLTKRFNYDYIIPHESTSNYVGENGKITYNNVNDVLNTYYEWGSNGLISRSYTLNSKNEKEYRNTYHHDNNGFVTKIVDSLFSETVFTETFTYDSQGQLTELNRDEQSGYSFRNYNTKFYYDNGGYIIKYIDSSTDFNGTNEGLTLITYDANHYPKEAIIADMSGAKQWKVIFEYKNEQRKSIQD